MDRYERILSLHRILKSARYPVTVKRLQDELGRILSFVAPSRPRLLQ